MIAPICANESAEFIIFIGRKILNFSFFQCDYWNDTVAHILSECDYTTFVDGVWVLLHGQQYFSCVEICNTYIPTDISDTQFLLQHTGAFERGFSTFFRARPQRYLTDNLIFQPQVCEKNNGSSCQHIRIFSPVISTSKLRVKLLLYHVRKTHVHKSPWAQRKRRGHANHEL